MRCWGCRVVLMESGIRVDIWCFFSGFIEIRVEVGGYVVWDCEVVVYYSMKWVRF